MDVKAMLAARAAAVQASKAEGALPGSVDASRAAGPTAEQLKDLGTGFSEQGSVGTVNALETADVYDFDEEKAKKAIAVYKQMTLRKFVKADGFWVTPQNGYYYAMDDEEATVLEHFASVGKVQKVEKK